MDQQKLIDLVRNYLQEGLNETAILKALKENDNEVITFMDLKMILADIDEMVEGERESSEDLNAEKAKFSKEFDHERENAGATTVSIDETPAHGARLSGSALLKSGASIKWAINGMGQFTLLPGGEGEPTDDDMVDFQRVLQAELQKKMGIF